MTPCRICGKPSFGPTGLCTAHRTPVPVAAKPDVRKIRHNSDPTTSTEAAEKIAAKLPAVATEALQFFKGAGPNGASQHDLGRAMEERSANPEGYAHSTHRSRVPELEEAGLLFRVGTKTDPVTGNSVGVYVHADFMGDHARPTRRAPRESLAKLRKERDELNDKLAPLWNALIAAAPHHQGGHSEVGRQIAAALDIPFPINPANIPPRKARSEQA